MRAGSTRTRSCRRTIVSTACSGLPPPFRGKPVLSAEQIEDVVAFLATLRTSRMIGNMANGRHGQDTTRRDVLRGAGMLALGCGIAPALMTRPAAATPAAMQAAIAKVVGEAQVKVGKVALDIPPLVENGNTVPCTVDGRQPDDARQLREGDSRVQREEPATERDQRASRPARRTRQPLDPHPALRHADGHGDRRVVRRLVLVSTPSRSSSRSAHAWRMPREYEERTHQRPGQGQARRGHRDQDADLARDGDRIPARQQPASCSRATSSRRSSPPTTARRFSAPSCFPPCRRTRSSRSTRSRPRAARSNSSGPATTATPRPNRPRSRWNERRNPPLRGNGCCGAGCRPGRHCIRCRRRDPARPSAARATTS